MERPEFRNPFSNAKVVATGVRSEAYLKNVKRGDCAFEVSRSMLVDFAQSPSRWIHGYRDDGSRSTEWGSLIDCLVLTPSQFDDLFAVQPENYTNKAGDVKPWHGSATECKAWNVDHDAKIIISHKMKVEADLAIERLKRDNEILELLECSATQVLVTADYRDKATDITVPVKCLLDIVPDAKHKTFGASLIDFKTTNDGSLYGWEKAIARYAYDVQAAFHTDIYTAATGEDRNTFRHLIQENFAPYEIGKRIVSEDFLTLGRDKYISALRQYCGCLVTNHWPTWEEQTNEKYLGWAFAQPNERMIKS